MGVALLCAVFLALPEAGHATSCFGNADPCLDMISPDGSRAFFETAESLAVDDTDTGEDLYERSNGSTALVPGSRAINPVGFSSDGLTVFVTTTLRLAASDTDSSGDVYALTGSSTIHLSRGAIGGNAAEEARYLEATEDGSRVLFLTAERLEVTDTDSSPDIYERVGVATTQVSRGQVRGNTNGACSVDLNGGSALSCEPRFNGISADGTRVFFSTYEQLTTNDNDDRLDVFERSGGATTRISRGAINGDTSGSCHTRPDGSLTPCDASFNGASSGGGKVFFSSSEQLAPTDDDELIDVYMRSGGVTTQVSVDENGDNGTGTDWVFSAARFNRTSADGRWVFFETTEQLASTDTDSQWDIYEHFEGNTTQVSQGEINGNGSDITYDAASPVGVSADGRKVLFRTYEQLATTDTDGAQDLYLRVGGRTIQVTIGNGSNVPEDDAWHLASSADLSRVVFRTGEQLVDEDDDQVTDIYEWSDGSVHLRSKGEINGNGAFGTGFAAASDDAEHVFFYSGEVLVPEDTDNRRDIYETVGDLTRLVTAGTGAPPSGGGGTGGSGPGRSGDGVTETGDVGLRVLKIDGPSSMRAFLRQGYRVLAACEKRCRVTVRIAVGEGTANRLGLASEVLARGTRRLQGRFQRWISARPRGAVARRLAKGGTGNLRVRIFIHGRPAG